MLLQDESVKEHRPIKAYLNSYVSKHITNIYLEGIRISCHEL